MGDGRWLGGVARHEREPAGTDPLEHAYQPREVHRLGEAVGDGLPHQRMIGDLAFAGEVLGAGNLVRENGTDQVLSLIHI